MSEIYKEAFREINKIKQSTCYYCKKKGKTQLVADGAILHYACNQCYETHEILRQKRGKNEKE